jgi:hypothetical protein
MKLFEIRPFQENESLFDGLEAAAEASIFGESIVCSGLTFTYKSMGQMILAIAAYST